MKRKQKAKQERITISLTNDTTENCTVICKCWCGKQMLVLREHGAVRYIRYDKDKMIKECRNVILAN